MEKKKDDYFVTLGNAYPDDKTFTIDENGLFQEIDLNDPERKEQDVDIGFDNSNEEE